MNSPVTNTCTILSLLSIQSFIIRLFSIVRHETILHEYDPYFNYRCAEILVKNGISEFWNLFDDGKNFISYTKIIFRKLVSAREKGRTNNLPRVLRYIGIECDIKYICIFLAPCVSVATVWLTYLLSMVIHTNKESALLSAFFIASMPSYLSRSIAGSFDNEAIAIFLLIASFYTWISAVKTGSITDATVSAVCTFFMATSWGGYVFVLNVIAAFTLACIILGVSPTKCSVTYIVYHLFITMLCYCLPVIGDSVFYSFEHLSTHVVSIVAIFYLIASCIGKRGWNNYLYTFAILSASLFIPLFKKRFSKINVQLSQRIISLFDPGYVQKYNPLVASVSEHQPTKWHSLLLDFWISLLFTPIGLYVCFKDGIEPEFLFLAIFGVVSSYFSVAMVRLSLIFAPASSLLGGLGSAYILQSLFKKKRKSVFKISLIFGLIATYTFHGVWASSNVYSNPNVFISWRGKSGNRIVADDFRDAYSWIRLNTDPESVIMAWWDYGYQLKQMADRTILTDNNTFNATHIATTAMVKRYTKYESIQIFASPEETAHKILKKLRVDYVMVVFGGVAKYSVDDVNKFSWMVKIASKDFPHIHPRKYILPRKGVSRMHLENTVIDKERRKQALERVTIVQTLLLQGIIGNRH
ncbi:conserved hypothetical protein [Theileria equi strain WA]|uniref:dolichyl-diphosphooligosaccharide--protein glycotransferase n=1 Tax=Theileria equi strain WA TaxID=1537102 RepID=L1LBT8_THEEQ|nr:conserved hypothetical protein [Theileria equi strain WA]EKX72902.1 conserved hypothetical protein [Theileria equi strain WA]|eukprot:XP_004832354.1 conserved hypothetical protein [Theileria equi strain WA]